MGAGTTEEGVEGNREMSQDRRKGDQPVLYNLSCWGLPWQSKWLRLPAPAAWGEGSIPSWGTEILHATQCS